MVTGAKHHYRGVSFGAAKASRQRGKGGKGYEFHQRSRRGAIFDPAVPDNYRKVESPVIASWGWRIGASETALFGQFCSDYGIP